MAKAIKHENIYLNYFVKCFHIIQTKLDPFYAFFELRSELSGIFYIE